MGLSKVSPDLYAYPKKTGKKQKKKTNRLDT